MRLLPDLQRKALLDEVCSYTHRTTTFQLPECGLHIQVIPGETEGLYGWIAANYLLGGFDHPEKHAHGKGHHTYGFLDMGGASAQIAFAPNATEAQKHANDLKLLRLRTIDGTALEYRVFVTTWLEYGANEARRRYIEALLETTDTNASKELPDPCLPRGLTVMKNGHVIPPGSAEDRGKETYLIGTGKFPECMRQTFPLLDKTAPCLDPPCLLHGVHVPAIDFDVNHFVGVSEYWHTTHEVFEMGHADKAYDFNTYQHRVNEFCSQDWSDIEVGIASHRYGQKVDETTAVEVCFKASWLINMLHDGIGIPRAGLEDTHRTDHNGTTELLDAASDAGYLAPFQAVNKIDDTEVSWTLGKMVLYASSQIPPANESALAVGFGANVGTSPYSLPADFQHAGGSTDADIFTHDDDDDADWHDHLLSTPSRHITSSLVFVSIVLVAILLFVLGRDRRAALSRFVLRRSGSSTRNAPASPRRRRPGLAGKLQLPFTMGGGGNGGDKHRYDRVLEDGLASDNMSAGDFELGALSSDSDLDADGSSAGAGAGSGSSRSSGGSGTSLRTARADPRRFAPATPAASSGTSMGASKSAGGSEYFDRVAPHVTMDRVGLGRTDSRDKAPVLKRSESAARVVLSRSESQARITSAGSRAASPSRWRAATGLGRTRSKESLD